VPWGALGKNVFAECRAQEALGKICFQKIKKNCRVPKDGTRQSFFFKKIKTNFAECLMAGTRQNLTVGGRRHGPAKFCRAPGRHSAKYRFAECLTLPSAKFCRVLHSAKYCFAECHDILHSAKYQALGKVQFSSSVLFRQAERHNHLNTM